MDRGVELGGRDVELVWGSLSVKERRRLGAFPFLPVTVIQGPFGGCAQVLGSLL